MQRVRSSAIGVLLSELARQRRLTIAVAVAASIESVFVYGISPYIVSLFAERIAANGLGSDWAYSLAKWAALVAVGHSLAFYLRVRWRRRLTLRGRKSLSQRLDDSIQKADANVCQRSGNVQSMSQKVQDAWVDLTCSAMDTMFPFAAGTISLLVFVGVRAPVLILPTLGIIALGACIAWISGRQFSAKERELVAISVNERRAYDAMFAVIRMKWLTEKFSRERLRRTMQYGEVYHEQAVHNTRWQGLLQGMGGVLRVSVLIGGPMLVGAGYDPSTAVLLVLLGYSLSERFLTITTALCMYSWIVYRMVPVATFIGDADQRATLPHLPDSESLTYVFRGVSGVYTGKDGERRCVRLPDVTLSPGVNILEGGSGVGKSTLVGVAEQALLYEGSVLVNGHELRSYDLSDRIVNGSQSFGGIELPILHLFDDANVDKKMLELAFQCAAYPDADVTSVLSELSGGQRRRVVLAAVIYHALVGDRTGLLIVDEPTNDLGASEIAQLVDGFGRLAELCPSLTIVIPTHEKRLEVIARQIITLLGDDRMSVRHQTNGGPS